MRDYFLAPRVRAFVICSLLETENTVVTGLSGFYLLILMLNKGKTKKEMTYTLVSESEADLNNGKIAINSPIAQGLLGKKVGDIAEIKVPSGMMTFEILNISI
jgi:hypothetical protein